MARDGHGQDTHRIDVLEEVSRPWCPPSKFAFVLLYHPAENSFRVHAISIKKKLTFDL